MSDDLHARLRVVHPVDLAWTRALPRDKTVLGRIEAQSISLVLSHGTVSRRHFLLDWDDAQQHHVGCDMGSHNGSRINGRDIGTTTAPLVDGTVLQLGDVCLVYETIPPELADEPPVPHDAPIPGQSPAMMALRRRMAELAPDSSPVLLMGERGTGKETIARQIHRLAQRTGPLIAADCSAMDPASAERRLFGKVGEPGLLQIAHEGTLFLDDIGELPESLQLRLLRALQRREIQPVGGTEAIPVDVRVIAASHDDLGPRVASGGFRSDLYSRLARWRLRVPPLRERRGDLLVWLHRLHTNWLDQRPEHPVNTLTLSADAAEAVLLFDWPENLRQLHRLVHELASVPHMPRPIPRSRLPNWLRSPDLTTSDARITAEVAPPPRTTAEVSRPPLLPVPDERD